MILRLALTLGPSVEFEVVRSVDSKDLRLKSVPHHVVRPEVNEARWVLNERWVSRDVGFHLLVVGPGIGNCTTKMEEV